MRSSIRRLLIASFLWSFGGMFVFFILNFHLEALGYSRDAIGLAQAVISGVGVVFALPVAYLIPRLGYRWAMIAAALSAGVGILGVGMNRAIYGALALYGVAGLVFQASVIPLLARLVTGHRRVGIYSLQAALTTAGGFAANLGAGYLTRVIPVENVLFFAIPSFLLVVLLLPAVSDRDEAPRSFRVEHPASWMALSFPQVLVGFGAGLVIPFLNLYLREKFGLDYAQLSWMFAVSSLATALSMLLQPRLSRRFGLVPTIALMQGLSLPFLAALAWAPWVPVVTASLLIRGALMNSAWPVFNALSMQCLGQEERPGFIAVQSALWSLTWAASSALSGRVQDALGIRAFDILFGGTLLLYGLATLYWAWIFPRLSGVCGRSRPGSV